MIASTGARNCCESGARHWSGGEVLPFSLLLPCTYVRSGSVQEAVLCPAGAPSDSEVLNGARCPVPRYVVTLRWAYPRSSWSMIRDAACLNCHLTYRAAASAR